MKSNLTILKWLFIMILVAGIQGCRQYDNFTTYFNTYYNAERLIRESEDEFEYQEEKKRINPRVFVPEPQIKFPGLPETGTPPFLKEFIIEEQKLKPVKIKLDSIEIKGSKILSRHPKSDYIEGTLYLMALAYFYESAWLPSQIKCAEQIDKFPDGDLSPDAHLLLSENLLIQRKFLAGKTMLSRTVDIAWQKERYDILSEAFRFQAELALYEENLDDAIRPYKQAIAQADDDELRARWQIDMAGLLYRMGKFAEAERAFAKVHKFSPDYVGQFEAYLYQSQSQMRLGRFEEAGKILESLENDGKYEEWLPYVFAARMNMARLQKNDKEFATAEKFADSAYMNNPAILSVYYEKGMDNFMANDYNAARKYFARSRNTRTPVFETSQQMFYLLNGWSQKLNDINQYNRKIEASPENDTLKALLAVNSFDLGRIHEQLGNKDSAVIYFQKAVKSSPPSDTTTARYYYAYSRVLQDSNPMLSDSLLEHLVLNYPSTEYGKDAIIKQGYTDKFVIDTVAELYTSGSALRQNKEYNFAIAQFLKVFTHYPESPLAPKSLYSVGWTFEKDLKKTDSALFYYQLLMEKYPQSEYAKDINLSVSYLAALNSGQPLPDSLKKREYKPRQRRFDPVRGDQGGIPPPPPDFRKPNEKNNPKSGFNPLDVISDPSKALKDTWDDMKDQYNKTKDDLIKTKDKLSTPDSLIPELKLPSNPFMKKDSTQTGGSPQDSTNIKPGK